MKPMLFAAAVLLTGCQTVGPTWSEVTGARYHVAVMDRAPVHIFRIDDQLRFGQSPIKIASGRHEIVVESLPHGSFPGGAQQTLVLDLEPCARYYLNAQFIDAVQPRFTAVVDEVERVSGCPRPVGNPLYR